MIRAYQSQNLLSGHFCVVAQLPSTQAFRRTPCHRRLFNSKATVDPPQRAHASIPEPFKVLFFGRDEFSCRVFQELHAAKDVWQGITIATNPDERVGRRGSKLSVSPLKLLGHSLDVPVSEIPSERAAFRTWQPPAPFATTDLSTPRPPHHLLITASFGRILSARLLAHFGPSHALNVHPSLLPSLRGPAPIQRALMAGEPRTGVCVIGMTRVVRGGGGVDVGDVWGRRELDMPEDATFPLLRDTLAEEGGKTLVAVMREMLAGTAKATPQAAYADPAVDPPPYAPFITADDARVRWESMSAEQIMRIHWALEHQRPLLTFLPDGRTSLQLHEPAVALGDGALPPGAATFEPATRTLLVRCADGGALRFGAVKQQDKKLVGAKDFWNGVREGWFERVEEGRKDSKMVRLRSEAEV